MSELRRVRGLMGGRGSVGPGRHPGSSCAWRIRESVTGRERGREAAEAIFQPNQTYIDVLTDVLRLEEKRCGQSDVAQAHEQMVVLDTPPTSSEQTRIRHPHRPRRPNGFRSLRREASRSSTAGVILVAGDGGTALYVKQDVVPSVADLTGNQPKCIDPRTVKVGCKEEADIVAAEIGPVALAFDALYPIGRLPAIADLTTDGAAGCVMAPFRPRQIAIRICQKGPSTRGRSRHRH
jgi:hypothetical protein